MWWFVAVTFLLALLLVADFLIKTSKAQGR
jgi:hypothetical protein